ncbi:MAG: hypothetical protein ACFFDN_41735, partial [Candidatus Hodarchaeota archaeon]
NLYKKIPQVNQEPANKGTKTCGILKLYQNSFYLFFVRRTWLPYRFITYIYSQAIIIAKYYNQNLIYGR